MNFEESIEQLENLIEAWQLNEADLNQTDIEAMKLLLKENEQLMKDIKYLFNALEKNDTQMTSKEMEVYDKYYMIFKRSKLNEICLKDKSN